MTASPIFSKCFAAKGSLAMPTAQGPHMMLLDAVPVPAPHALAALARLPVPETVAPCCNGCALAVSCSSLDTSKWLRSRCFLPTNELF